MHVSAGCAGVQWAATQQSILKSGPALRYGLQSKNSAPGQSDSSPRSRVSDVGPLPNDIMSMNIR